VAASAGFGVFQKLVQLASTVVLMPVMLHALGPARFGVWGAAASLAWLSGVMDIGTGSALVTLVARAVARGHGHEARRHVAGALTLGICISLPLLLLLTIAWACGAGRGDGAVYLIALVGLTINLPLHSASNVFMALQEGYYAGFWELVQTVLTTAGLLVAALSTQDVRVCVGVVYGGLVLSNLASLIHLFVLHAELRPERLPERVAAVREVFSSGVMFFLMGIAGSLSFMLDNVLALQLLGPEASAQMTIALRICIAAVGMLVVLSQPLWPAFTDAAHQSDRHWIERNLARGMALLTGVSLAGSVVLVLWGERLLRLWLHGALDISRGLLIAISAWIIVQALIRVPNLLLNGLLLIRFQTAVFAIATTLALALKFVLAGRFGVSGILWATTVGVAGIAVPASLWRIRLWEHHAEAEMGHGAKLTSGSAIRK